MRSKSYHVRDSNVRMDWTTTVTALRITRMISAAAARPTTTKRTLARSVRTVKITTTTDERTTRMIPDVRADRTTTNSMLRLHSVVMASIMTQTAVWT